MPSAASKPRSADLDRSETDASRKSQKSSSRRSSVKAAAQKEKEDPSKKKSVVIEDRVAHEAGLCKKYGIEKIQGKGVVDTNVAGRVLGGGGLLSKYAEGELECLFLEKVQANDVAWVAETLSKGGREVLFSPYGGGITKTCILYAAQEGNGEMVRTLVRYGGKDLLAVKNLKGRDPQFYAEQNGFDLSKATADATVDCWNEKYVSAGAAKSGSGGSGSKKSGVKGSVAPPPSTSDGTPPRGKRSNLRSAPKSRTVAPSAGAAGAEGSGA